jgi:uncharacterized protein (TIGR03437 family)
MHRLHRFDSLLAAHVAALILPFALLPARGASQPPRIAGNINPRQWIALKDNVHPNARSEYDQGQADPSLQMQSLILVLKPSASQQTALDKLLADQQDPTSSNYHQWLTPEQYADRFGVTESDVDKIVAWAQSQHLTVTGVARARNAVRLAGTAANVGSAFHTEIHMYQVNGEMHYANATPPSVPAALHGVVAAIRGLHNFRVRPRLHKLTPLGVAADGAGPMYTSPSSGNHYLAPDDFATIFNLTPLYNAGMNGSGQKIVIVGQSQIDSSHLSAFTNYFGLSNVSVTSILVPNTQDPGISQSDEQEADLDLEWASAVARGASLVFVYSYDVFDAIQYAIDQNLAPVLSTSYGECEEASTQSDAASFRTWAQQANAQGMTIVSASGDSGAADCYQPSTGHFGSANASLAVAVDMPASLPEVTGIGGTTLNDGDGNYWNSTNTSTKASAQSYIPEVAWNDSAVDGSPAASGGGASQFFSKPPWQIGTGVPNDGARDVPDIAFPASADHDGYMVYTISGHQAGWYVFGGTSCGAPAFSGLLAVLNQYLVSNGYQAASGLGNINIRLYSLASSAPASFHDITSGNNIVIARTCSRCTTTNTSEGFNAGVGYDQVTGLGSVDAYSFVTAWRSGNAQFKSTPKLVAAASPDILTTAGTTTLTATVTNPIGNTPTGTVAFSAGSTLLGTVTLSGASGTSRAELSIAGGINGLALGANTITAVYEGDNFNSPAAATTVLTLLSLSSVTPSITGLTNSASYAQSYAPGMILSIFGSNLALTTAPANSVPLPVSLDNISVTVNGVPAPLYYVSPTQLNVQIPYETPASGTATVVVSNNGKTASASIGMSPAAPGIFTDANRAIVPDSTAARGQTIAIYVTGAGMVEPSVATGAMPGNGAAPVPAGTTLVTVGGVQASTVFVGIPSWSIGVLQINFVVPSTVPAGAQPVVVSVGGLASAAATLNVTN